MDVYPSFLVARADAQPFLLEKKTYATFGIFGIRFGGKGFKYPKIDKS